MFGHLHYLLSVGCDGDVLSLVLSNYEEQNSYIRAVSVILVAA